jgi:hypothetical protein
MRFMTSRLFISLCQHVCSASQPDRKKASNDQLLIYLSCSKQKPIGRRVLTDRLFTNIPGSMFGAGIAWNGGSYSLKSYLSGCSEPNMRIPTTDQLFISPWQLVQSLTGESLTLISCLFLLGSMFGAGTAWQRDSYILTYKLAGRMFGA